MKINKHDKIVSDTMREASKQRLERALKQAQIRLGNIKYVRNSDCIMDFLFFLNFYI